MKRPPEVDVKMHLSKTRWAWLGILAISWAVPAYSISIEDGARFFSNEAITQAEQEIREIYKNTEPHKDVLVKTVTRLPEGNSAVTEAERLFRERRVGGVLVFIVKNPHRLVVTVGKETERYFTSKNAVKQAMLEGFKRRDYDAGLTSGVDILRRDLVAAFPVDVGTSSHRKGAAPFRDEAYAASGRSGSGWWILLIVVGGIFLIWRFLRRGSNSPTQFPLSQNPGMGPGGGFGNGGGFGGGGGFGRGILGGVLGASGGNWLYDRFMNPHHNESLSDSRDYDRGTSARADEARNDDGVVGSSTEDSWSSGDRREQDWESGSGGTDGGDTSDFGGGDSDSGGGGDW
jgi:uncharacterized membrane protein YgcG